MVGSMVVITGASSGIGAAFARRLAPTCDLLLIARRKDRLEALATELSGALPSRIEVLAADLTVEADLQKAADRIEREPRLSLLINNAGFGSKGRFWEGPFKVQEDMHKLHVMAAARLTHAALRNMVPRDYGGIINVASVAAFLRSPGSASYCATKAWMTAFTEAIHLELRGVKSRVVVQALCPGFTYSEFHDAMGVEREKLAPPGFWLSAEEVVDASLEGLGKRKLFVTPNWRYQVLLAIATKLPLAWRVFLESSGGRNRERLLAEGAKVKQITNEPGSGERSR